jgi:hypothetical protein
MHGKAMKQRDVITLLGGAAVAAPAVLPPVAQAQQVRKPVVG